MLEKRNLKELEKTRYASEVGFQAAIPQHPARKRSPKREVKTHVSQGSNKGRRIRGMGSKRMAQAKSNAAGL